MRWTYKLKMYSQFLWDVAGSLFTKKRIMWQFGPSTHDIPHLMRIFRRSFHIIRWENLWATEWFFRIAIVFYSLIKKPSIALGIRSTYYQTMAFAMGLKQNKVPIIMAQEGGPTGYINDPMVERIEMKLADYLFVYGLGVAETLNAVKTIEAKYQ